MADLSYSAFKPDRKRTPCFPSKTFSFFLCDFQIHKLRIDQRIALIAAANLHPFFKCRAALVQWVDDDEVGLLSHLERTQPVVDVQEPRSVQRRHGHRFRHWNFQSVDQVEHVLQKQPSAAVDRAVRQMNFPVRFQRFRGLTDLIRARAACGSDCRCQSSSKSYPTVSSSAEFQSSADRRG